MRVALNFYKVLGLPAEPQPDSVYYVLDTDNQVSDMWVTDEDGNAFPASQASVLRSLMTWPSIANKPVIRGVLLSSVSVDLNDGTETKQPLVLVPASRRLIVTDLDIDKLSAIPSAAEITVGWNNPANNLLSDPFHLPDLLTDTDSFASLLAPSRSILVGTASQVLGVNVTTPEGSPLTCRVNTFGYLTDTAGVPVVA